MVNSKHEIRNPKQTQMFQIQMSQTKVLNLENLKFGFVSDFDIRISDFVLTLKRA